ncbi:MAG: acriflavin resistance protein, partial [Clostridiales bacterium]|nr:acriflavin resistance protein [Clostridiales bacterium]
MSKFSVKKPLTVFVAVLAVIVLGVVAFLKMTPDLLPNMDFPFVIVMTTYPGATPEKVETAITKPLEQQMATLENIKTVSSTSAENYSMISLEFTEDADLDALTVDILQKISTVEGAWEDTVGTPYILKINPSMLPVMVSAVSMEGMDTIALSEFVDNTLLQELEGTTGIASVSASGIITESMNVVLSEEKIAALNEKLFALIDEEFEEPEAELSDALEEIEKGQEEIEKGKDALAGGEAELDEKLDEAREEIAKGEEELVSGRKQINRTIRELNDTKDELNGNLKQLQQLESTLSTLAATKTELESAVSGLESAIGVIDTCGPAVAQVEAAIAAINGNSALSEEEKQQQIAALEGDPNYIQAKAALSQVDASLAAQGLDRAGAKAAYQQAKAGLEQVNGHFATIDNTLAGMGMGRGDIPGAIAKIKDGIAQVDAGLSELQYAKDQLKDGEAEIENAYAMLEEEREKALDQMAGAATKLEEGEKQLEDALKEVEDGIEQLEKAKKDAHKQADLKNIITMEMAANILAAQDFAMPAGYVKEDGISWLVSVGDEFESVDEMENLLLFDLGMEGMDPIYLSDVGDVFVTDNASTTYSRINGADGVMLTFQKQSTAATAEASDNLLAKFEALEEEYEGLSFVPLMDQGDYIYLITDAIYSSLIWGAVFAIIILFLFLKDLKPTFITLCSIPISVIFAIVLMYFSGVTLNMISLSGLAVSVGMLVDNSVVVIENIYRLRAKGLSATKAAVSGAAQVAAAITSSTLTTVCVFVPIVFVEGITRQLFTDMAL